MDTSPEYIKMCEKAVPVRQGHVLQDGDWYTLATREGYKKPEPFCCMCDDRVGGDGGSWQAIWLPRQDQLQAMLRTSPSSAWVDNPHDCELAMLLVEFIYEETERRNELRLPDSMEQLWLAFVMKEKYQKHWTGTDWGAE